MGIQNRVWKQKESQSVGIWTVLALQRPGQCLVMRVASGSKASVSTRESSDLLTAS